MVFVSGARRQVVICLGGIFRAAAEAGGHRRCVGLQAVQGLGSVEVHVGTRRMVGPGRVGRLG